MVVPPFRQTEALVATAFPASGVPEHAGKSPNTTLLDTSSNLQLALLAKNGSPDPLCPYILKVIGLPNEEEVVVIDGLIAAHVLLLFKDPVPTLLLKLSWLLLME
jgi:hypothetical protein